MSCAIGRRGQKILCRFKDIYGAVLQETKTIEPDREKYFFPARLLLTSHSRGLTAHLLTLDLLMEKDGGPK